MTTEKEIRERQQHVLYDLLKLVRDYPELDKHKGVQDLIKRAKSAMDKEDVAWVEKILAE